MGAIHFERARQVFEPSTERVIERFLFLADCMRPVPLRVWFRWMARQRLILHNPASELERPKLGYRLPKHVLTVQEAELVLQQPDVHDPLGLRDRALLETLYSNRHAATRAVAAEAV